MKRARPHASLAWIITLAAFTLAAGAMLVVQHQRALDEVEALDAEADALAELEARGAALLALTSERIGVVTAALEDRPPTASLSRDRILAMSQFTDVLVELAAGGGLLADAASLARERLGVVRDPDDPGLSIGDRLDAYVELDDQLCCPLEGVRNQVDSPRLLMFDETLTELTIDAYRFDRIAAGYALFEGQTEGAAGSIEDWLAIDIELAAGAPESFAGVETGEREVVAGDADVATGMRSLNDLASERRVRAADAWVLSGSAAQGVEPDLPLNDLAHQARATVNQSAIFFAGLIAEHRLAVDEALGSKGGQVAALRVLLLVVGAILAGPAAAAVRRARRAREQAVQDRQEAARQLRFLANVSHEIRSPLTAISGFVEMLRGDFGTLAEEEVREYLEIVGAEARKLSALVEDVLTVSKLEADQLTMNIGVVELRPAIQNVLDVVFADSDAQVTLDAPNEASVRADDLRLGQVLRNLTENARKYGGPRVNVRVRSNGTHYRIEVVDNGRGVPVEDRDRIFQRFEQSSTALGSGFGLGLSIAHDLTEAMGGQMGYTPGEPSGAVFWFTVPAATLSRAA